MAGILELLRGTTDPTTPGTGLGDIYFKGASDAAMLLYFRRPDGTVVELASASGGLVLPSQGGTGIANNNASTLAITGAFATTVTVTGTTGVTLPTSGTLATLAGSETFSNKTLSGYVLTGNVTSTGNPSLNIGSGALTAGATGVTSLTASNTVQITGGATTPASGSGLELAGGSATSITSFNRTGSAYLATGYNALSHTFSSSGITALTIDSGGVVTAAGAFGAGATTVTTLTASGLVTMNGGGSVTSGQTFVTNDVRSFSGDSINISAIGAGTIGLWTNGGQRVSITDTGINNTVLGATTPAAGYFTDVRNRSLRSTGRIFSVGDTTFDDLSTTTGAAVLTYDTTGQHAYVVSRNYNAANYTPLTMAASSIIASINDVTITTTSSTGLAVTGALSATGSVTAGDGAADKLTVIGGGASASTIDLKGGNSNDNAAISSVYSMAFQVDNTNAIGGREFSWRKGGYGYSDGTHLMTLDASGNLNIVGTVTPAKGADVASASTTTLGIGNFFDITGTTTISNITIKPAGTMVVLKFADSLTVQTGTVGVSGALRLAGGAGFGASQYDTLTIISDGTNWWQVASSAN